MELYKLDPNIKLKDIDSGKSIAATGKPHEIERGFGQTAKTLKEIQDILGPEATVEDAYDQLQNRLRSKIDDISKTKNHRFKNIKNYPEEYQYILVSIADNIGIEGLNKYEKLQKAMDSKDNEKIKKEMVTVSSKEPEKYNKGLKNRANTIYDALFLTEGIK
jgi:CRISPR/Cas system CMR-associated protein Cmr1 (group 7 of RAMP superfamily)